MYNDTRDCDMLRTNIVLPQSHYDEYTRDTVIAVNGVGIYGNVPLGNAGIVTYLAIAGIMNPDAESGFHKWGNNHLLLANAEIAGTVDFDTTPFGSMQWYPPIPGLIISGHVVGTRNKTPLRFASGLETRLPGYGLLWSTGLEYTWNNLVVAMEGHNVNGTGSVLRVDNPASKTDWTVTTWYYGAAKMSFNF
ncbi:MAG: hypothetical protein KJP07_09175 [Desulfatitalea sp.]|nr:hypothetical protein [Desulfatitalea sp.]